MRGQVGNIHRQHSRFIIGRWPTPCLPAIVDYGRNVGKLPPHDRFVFNFGNHARVPLLPSAVRNCRKNRRSYGLTEHLKCRQNPSRVNFLVGPKLLRGSLRPAPSRYNLNGIFPGTFPSCS